MKKDTIEKISEIGTSELSYIDKIKQVKETLIQDIEKYVTENAKFKVGDIINITFENYTYVITHLGYQTYHGIVYYGVRVKKNGEISFMSMASSVGVPERSITKTSIKVGNETIDRFEESKQFSSNIKVTL